MLCFERNLGRLCCHGNNHSAAPIRGANIRKKSGLSSNLTAKGVSCCFFSFKGLIYISIVLPLK